MTDFQHSFDSIEGYLHHRPPYLLVQQIMSIGEAEITTGSVVPDDAFFITGHFPGAPILPGAMMQELTTQSAGILIAAKFNPMEAFNTEDPFFNEYALGVLVKVKRANYRSFARPGNQLKATIKLVERVGDVFDFSGKIEVDGRTILRNAFQLANIPSSLLQGTTTSN